MTKEIYETNEEDDYDEEYFDADVEQAYIKETGELPYNKGDKDLSKDFQNLLQNRWAKERAELEKKEEINDCCIQ